MHVNEQSSMYHAFDSRPDNEGYYDTVEVECVTLDSQIGKRRVSFVKIDVEGGEYRVFEGMRGILENNHRIVILFEFIVPNFRRSVGDPAEFLRGLASQGFSLHYKDQKSVSIMRVADIDGLVSRYDHPPRNPDGHPVGTSVIAVRGWDDPSEPSPEATRSARRTARAAARTRRERPRPRPATGHPSAGT